jgi:hypothetical protein
VTMHDKRELNCRNGHWCGLGIISGQGHRCECAPYALKQDPQTPF